MDETPDHAAPSAASLESRRRRLLFRASHRGTRETDLMVGGYVSARFAHLTAAEIGELEKVMDLPDPLLADWLTGRVALPEHPQRALLEDMRREALASVAAMRGA